MSKRVIVYFNRLVKFKLYFEKVFYLVVLCYTVQLIQNVTSINVYFTSLPLRLVFFFFHFQKYFLSSIFFFTRFYKVNIKQFKVLRSLFEIKERL